MANSVNPDQPAPPGAGWSGFTLFGQANLSKYYWRIWYPLSFIILLLNLDRQPIQPTSADEAQWS